MDENMNTNTNPVDMRVTGSQDAPKEPQNGETEKINLESTKTETPNDGNIGIVIPNASSTSIEGEISEEVKKAAEKYAELYGDKKVTNDKAAEDTRSDLEKELDSLDLDESTYVVDAAPFEQAIQAYDQNKKQSFKFIFVAIAALLIIVVAVVGFNFKVIDNAIKKKSMAPEEYTQYIISKNAHAAAEYYASQYEKNFTNGIFSNNIDATASVSFQITEDGFEFLDDLDVDVDDIEDLEIFKDSITVAYSGKHYKDLSNISLEFISGKKTMYSMDLIFNKPEKMVYIGLPQFGKDYAAINLEDFYTDDEIDDLYSIINSIDHIGEILITPDKLEKIMERYEDIAISSINIVDMSTDTISVGKYDKKVTVLEFKLNRKLIANMIKAMAKELVEDEEIKSIVSDISTIEYIEDADDFMDNYEEFMDLIDENIDNIDDLTSDINLNVDLSLYVDNKGEIIGFNMNYKYSHYFYDWEVDDYITTDSTINMYAAYIISGNKFAFEALVEEDGDEELSVEATGKAAGSKLSGTFTFEADDEDVELEIEKLDLAKLKKGYFDAKISLAFDQFGKSIPKPARDLVIVLDINGSKDTYGIELLNEKTLLMKGEVKTEISKKANISIPKNTVSVEDANDIEDFLEDLDFSSLEDMLDDMDIDNGDKLIGNITHELGEYIENNLPIETLLVPEIGIPTNPVIPIYAGVMAPQLIKYIEKARISADTMFADEIRTAISVASMDPAVLSSNDGSLDSLDELYYGVDITTWGKPSNAFQTAVADTLGIKNFSDLDKQIKSKYTGEGIWVTYDSYYDSYTVELRNTDRYGWGDLDGYYNITAGGY